MKLSRLLTALTLGLGLTLALLLTLGPGLILAAQAASLAKPLAVPITFTLDLAASNVLTGVAISSDTSSSSDSVGLSVAGDGGIYLPIIFKSN